MKTDSEILKDVKDELKWESRINGSNVSVEVKDGIVSMMGTIDSYTKKQDAERAAVRVGGVKGILNLLEVKIPLSQQKTDLEIKEAIMNSIKWNSSIDENKIKVNVKNGQVSLTGEVSWDYQKSKLRNLAVDIMGVSSITNLVRVIPDSKTPGDAKNRIESALKRSLYLNTNRINVSVEGNRAILTGEVRSVEERGAAESAAWSAPGINSVENRLLVSFTEIFA